MEKIVDGIWAAERDFRLPGGVIFRSRMTAIDTGGGELLLYSPVELSDEDLTQLRAAGDVRWIMAPNDLHQEDLGWMAEKFPEARVAATESVQARNPGLNFAEFVDGWGGLRRVTLGGAPRLNETVLVHEATESLICADIVFNINEVPNFLTSLVLRMVGCHRCFAQSRSMRYLFVKDRAAFGASVSALMAHDFDRIIMCHGDVVEEGGHALLERELEWVQPHRVALLEAS